MKEFVDKLIEKLEKEVLASTECKAEAQAGMNGSSVGRFCGEIYAYNKAKKIANQLAEEHKTKVMINEQYCWQTCVCTEKCNECRRLSGNDTDMDWYEDIEDWVDEHNNGFCEWEDTETLRKKGIHYSNDGLYKPSCNDDEDDFRDWNWIRHFKFCPYCGKKIKVVE